jgi:polyisoprenoid-binding protein YceI
MKQLSLILLSTIFLFAIGCKQSSTEKAATGEATKEAAITGQTLSVNTDQSTMTWTGSKIGGSHTGTIKIVSGRLALKGGEITGGNFTIDMNSIVNTDLPPAKQGDLVGHLKNEDFFDVAKYPTSKFAITNVTKLTNEPGATHLIYGNLTLKDVTKEIGFKANVKIDGNSAVVTTPKFAIDRSDFNVKYGSAKFFDNLKDKAINDNIDFVVRLVAS